MLILTRRVGESLFIGNEIVVTITYARGQRIRLRIDAPRCTAIGRYPPSRVAGLSPELPPPSRLARTGVHLSQPIRPARSRNPASAGPVLTTTRVALPA